MKIFKYFSFGFIFAFLVSCVSNNVGSAKNPIVLDMEPEITLTYVGNNELSRFGITFDENPFRPAPNFVSKNQEFFSFIVKLNLKEAKTVEYSAKMLGTESGKEIGNLYTAEELKDYWALGNKIDKSINARLSYIDRYYPLSQKFTARSGTTNFVLSILAKKPVEKPSVIYISIFLDGEVTSFELPIEESVKKQ